VPPLPEEPSVARKGAGRLFRDLSRPLRGSLLAFLAMLAFPLFALAAYAGAIRGDSSSGGGGSGEVARMPTSLRLGGHATGLYPGSAQRLRVHVYNPSRRAVTVHSIQVLVEDASRRCSARNVSVGSYGGALRVPPHQRRFVLLRISMRADAASACQSAKFPLAYRAGTSR
jgi:hypothetical protein